MVDQGLMYFLLVVPELVPFRRKIRAFPTELLFYRIANSIHLAGCQRRTLTARCTHVGHENGTRMKENNSFLSWLVIARFGHTRSLTLVGKFYSG
jgi:hypothetical protein